MSKITKILTDKEREDLGVHEFVISQGLNAFMEVGIAWLDIRDRRLYRETHPTFESYCRERWKVGKSRAYQIIDAAKVANEMSTIGGQTPIENERQARALAAVVPHLREAVLERIEETGEKITEQNVAKAVSALLEEQKQQQQDRAEETREEDGSGEDESEEEMPTKHTHREETPTERAHRNAASTLTDEERDKVEAQARRWVRKGERLALALGCTPKDLLKHYAAGDVPAA